ncbi:MAG: hypothetical protein Sapg2KO_25080 [Saprospiraceae bacterium]
MQELRELALMVDPSELKLTTNNLLVLQSDAKIASLFKGITSGDYNSDEEALRDLYSEDSSTSGYRKLKFTLKQRLKNAVLLFNEHNKDYSDYQKAYYQCYKEFSVIKILLGRHAQAAAADIAQGTLKKAIKYEFTDLVVDMCKVLRMHYGARVGNAEKFKHYNDIFQEYKILLDQEEAIQGDYIDLIINYVNNRSPKSNQHEQAKKVADSMRAACTQRDSYQAQLYFFLVELMVQTTIYNYEEALNICEKAISYFSSKAYNADVPLQIFYYQELVCHIQLGHFESGQKVIKNSLELVSDGSFNWFKYHELYLLLAIQTGRYEEAADIFKQVIDHRRFSFLPNNFKEVWQIYQSYLYYLMIVGKIEDASIFNDFKLSRFLNEVLIYSKDKSGLNASILTVQLLILIVEGRYEEATARYESMQQYCYRYLKTEYTQRSYLFMKMLLKTLQFSFDKKIITKKTAKLLGQLEQVPFEVANQAMEIETIPYETIWEMLLDSL